MHAMGVIQTPLYTQARLALVCCVLWAHRYNEDVLMVAPAVRLPEVTVLSNTLRREPTAVCLSRLYTDLTPDMLITFPQLIHVVPIVTVPLTLLL